MTKPCSVCKKQKSNGTPYVCPNCGTILYLCKECKSKLIKCPKCGTSFTIEKEEKWGM